VVREDLFIAYQKFGGASDEARMSRYLVLFSHIFDHEESPHGWGGFQLEDHACSGCALRP